MSYNWSFETVWSYNHLLLEAVGVTLWLSVLTILFTLPLALFITLVRLSRFRLAIHLVRWLVEIVRSIPPLVFVVWIYYCLPILLDVKLSAIQTVVVALSIYSSVFFAEIFRAGIQSIEPGFLEAAYSAGMTKLTAFRRITAPLAFRNTFPAFISQCVLVLKSTSLASVVAAPELLYIGQRISLEVFRPMEVFTTIALIYVMMVLPLTWIGNYLEQRWIKKTSQ